MNWLIEHWWHVLVLYASHGLVLAVMVRVCQGLDRSSRSLSRSERTKQLAVGFLLWPIVVIAMILALAYGYSGGFGESLKREYPDEDHVR